MSSGILGYLLRLGFFLVVGPIMGGLAIAVGATVTGHPEMLYVVIAVPFFLIGCYVGGWKAALLTGVIVSFIGPHFETRRTIVLTAAVIGAVASYLLPPGHGFPEDARLSFAGAGAAAAAACAWFLDRWRLMRPGELMSA